METCTHVLKIGAGRYAKSPDHKNRFICIQVCPTCGTEHRILVNWKGPTPKGGFTCKGVIKSSTSAEHPAKL